MTDAKIKGISIVIAGRSYSLKVVEHEVEMIERLAREINQKVADLQSKYTANDKQDCLAMALLTYAVDLARKDQETPCEWVEKIDAIQSELQNLL